MKDVMFIIILCAMAMFTWLTIYSINEQSSEEHQQILEQLSWINEVLTLTK